MRSWRQKMDELKDQLAKVPGITIVPKHSVERLLGPRCKACGHQIVLATGGLLEGKYCGPCYTALKADERDLRSPPAA